MNSYFNFLYKIGDVIRFFNGTPITSPSDFEKQVSSCEVCGLLEYWKTGILDGSWNTGETGYLSNG